MKKAIIIFLLLLFLVSCAQKGPLGRIIQSNMHEMDKIQTEQVHEVTKVIDGNIFEIETGDRVRLLCIETPEKGERYYNEAKAFLDSELMDKRVTLVKDVSDRDKYLRQLRYAYVGDEFINARLVEMGYAKVKRQEPDIKKCDELEALQNKAREKKIGIWS